jgi:protein arginine kinase activator
MTCERCAAVATVHLTESIEGRLREVHLCRDCARAVGVLAAAPPALPDLDTVVAKLVNKHVEKLAGELSRRVCPGCGRGFLDFRIEGRLGCPEDYRSFAAGLGPLIRQVHAGSRHVGKRPRREIDSERAFRRLGLRSELREAIAREDFEAAASLRDRLRNEA